MKQPETQRIAAYCRVSTQEQADGGFSIAMQKEMARQWCEDNCNGDHTLTVFADEGYSGKLGWERPNDGRSSYRPELARLAEATAAGEIDRVVVYRLDRLARSMSITTTFFEERIAANGVAFTSLSENIDYGSTEGKLIAHILAAVADHQRNIIAENIKSAHAQRKREGLPIGTHYGWQSVPPEREGMRPTIGPVPGQAVWIPKIFDWYLRGWSLHRIAKRLDQRDAPTHPQAERWSKHSVKTVLTNPVNAGKIDVEGELIDGQHYKHRIIEPELFHRVQQEFEARRVEGKKPISHKLFPLYKVAECGICGQPLQITRQRVSDDGYSYRCRGSEWDYKETCSGWQKDHRLVDGAVVKQLATFVDRPSFQETLAKEAQRAVMDRHVDALQERKEQLEKSLKDCRQQEQRLLRLWRKGTVDEDLYEAEYDALEQERDGCRTELRRVTAQLGDQAERSALLKQVQEAVSNIQDIWEKLNADERRQLMREIIEYCYVEPIGDRQHRIRVKFHFLPEAQEELPNTKARSTGLFDNVASIPDRELAYLTLRSDGVTEDEIQDRWNVTIQATSYLRHSVLDRLGVETVQEAIRLAKRRIEEERDELPLGPTGWHTGRPKEGHIPSRIEEALVRYIRTTDAEAVAKQMGLEAKTVGCYLWKARDILNCDSRDECIEKYLEQKGGKLPGFGDQLAMDD